VVDALRPARAGDVDAVLAIDSSAASGDDARKRRVRDAIAASECMVCEHDARIVGFAITRVRHFFDRDFVELLLVTPDARRRGVGGALLRAAVDGATTTTVFTSTNRSNDAMQALLARDGWVLSGELEGLDEGDPELVYFMVRDASG
jgi:GNAT superfamily N-acetyltransferase